MNNKNIIFIFLLACSFVGCRKKVLYVNEIHIPVENTQKKYQKTPSQFISIAWSDLTGTTIDPQYRDNLQGGYESFGDEQFIESWIIRNMMQRPEVKIPPRDSMVINPDSFIRSSYLKFFNREPSGIEIWSIIELIKQDSSMQISPKIFWLSIMESDEYRKI